MLMASSIDVVVVVFVFVLATINDNGWLVIIVTKAITMTINNCILIFLVLSFTTREINPTQ